MKNRFYYLLLLIVLYIIFFNPPFRGLTGLTSPFYCIFFISLILYAHKPEIVANHISIFKVETKLLVLLFLYIEFRSLIEGEINVSVIISTIILIITIPVLLYYAEQAGINTDSKVVRSILLVGSIAAVISVLCLTMPGFNFFVRERIVEYEGLLEIVEFRGFGIADHLSSSYGYVLGFIIVLSLFYYSNNKWFILFIPLMLLTVFVNARTGALITFSGIIIYFWGQRKLLPFLVLITVIPLVYIYFVDILLLFNLDEQIIIFIMEFFEEMSLSIGDRDLTSSTTGSLFYEMLVLPSSLDQWVFGSGVDLFATGEKGRHSDIGWIVQLYYGGLFYLLLLIAFFYYLYRRLVRVRKKTFALFFICTIAIINTKSVIYPPYTDMYFIMLLYYSIVSHNIESRNTLVIVSH